jgi:hypothetical protein
MSRSSSKWEMQQVSTSTFLREGCARRHQGGVGGEGGVAANGDRC